MGNKGGKNDKGNVIDASKRTRPSAGTSDEDGLKKIKARGVSLKKMLEVRPSPSSHSLAFDSIVLSYYINYIFVPNL